jgi:hypothetical protein
MHYIAFKAFGSYMIPVFLTVGFINLTLQSIIMTFIFVKSKGSIKLMILYHYTITASSILVGALFTAETTPRLTFNESIISVLLFAMVATSMYIKNKNFLGNTTMLKLHSSSYPNWADKKGNISSFKTM